MEEYLLLFRNFLILVSVVLPVLYLLGFVKYGKAFKAFTIYLSFIALIQIVVFYYSLNKWNNIFLFHFYFIGQFLFLSYFYYLLLKSKWVLVLIGLCSLILAYTYIEDPTIYNQYHSFGAVLTHSLMVIFALVYYYRSLSKKSDFIYVNAAILIYFLSSTLYYASGNLVINLGLPKKTQHYIGLVNDVLYALFLVLIYIEWHKNYRKLVAK